MNKLAAEIESALWNDVKLASKLGVSRSMIHKLNAAGKLPPPVRLGRCLRWRAAEINAWLAAGCPSRAAWAWEMASDG